MTDVIDLLRYGALTSSSVDLEGPVWVGLEGRGGVGGWDI